MAGLPTHSDTGDERGAKDPGEPSAGPASRRKVVWFAIGAAVVAVFVVLHLAGVVGAGSHG